MANRTKAERNQKILALWDNGKGWKQKSIARMFKMTESAVSMVILRANHRKGGEATLKEEIGTEIQEARSSELPASEGVR